MAREEAVFGAIMFATIAALTSLASVKIGAPDANGAVAAALTEHFGEWVGLEALQQKGSTPPLKLCLETEVPLQINAVAHDLSNTIIEPIPVARCTSERIEGDFGMFTAITKYYDETGEEAAHVIVVEVSCSTSKTCRVDIDDFGAGMSYEAQQQGSAWKVVERDPRWVV